MKLQTTAGRGACKFRSDVILSQSEMYVVATLWANQSPPMAEFDNMAEFDSVQDSTPCASPDRKQRHGNARWKSRRRSVRLVITTRTLLNVPKSASASAQKAAGAEGKTRASHVPSDVGLETACV